MSIKRVQSTKEFQYEKMENSFWITAGLEEKGKGL